MSRNDPQLKLRLPVEIKDQIESISEKTGRSMNAEIVRRLEWVLGDGKNFYDCDGPDYPDHLKKLEQPSTSNPIRANHSDTRGYDMEGVPHVSALSVDEMSWVRLWRAMGEGERAALLAVALRLADRVDPPSL